MCYTCGCGDLTDKHGHDDQVASDNFVKAAQSNHQTAEEAKENAYQALRKELGHS